MEEIEVEPEDVGEEEYAADVDGEGAGGLVDKDESVLVEVADDGANSHSHIKKNIHLILTLLTLLTFPYALYYYVIKIQ